jgi:hypothetical protein
MPMTRPLIVLAAAALAALSASSCGASVTSPSDAPVRVTVRVNPTFAGDPTSANFSLSAENITRGAVDLTFPSSCQLMPFFVELSTRRPVTPVGGGFACLAVITRATLQPGERLTQTVLVKAGTTPAGADVVLPPGDYLIYARLEDQNLQLKSAELPFSVR